MLHYWLELIQLHFADLEVDAVLLAQLAEDNLAELVDTIAAAGTGVEADSSIFALIRLHPLYPAALRNLSAQLAGGRLRKFCLDYC